tara:strand:- start:1654 stop:2034 length:381 start_codon:yes stop_codon:yes gene_type:complete
MKQSLKVFLLTVFGLVSPVVYSQEDAEPFLNQKVEFQLNNTHFEFIESQQEPKNQRLKAALLSIFLGHFGVHRIYLGTTPNVPVVYSLTLGGGLGLLPLADFVAILSTKDLDRYKDSKQVFMWLKK